MPHRFAARYLEPVLPGNNGLAKKFMSIGRDGDFGRLKAVVPITLLANSGLTPLAIEKSIGRQQRNEQ